MNRAAAVVAVVSVAFIAACLLILAARKANQRDELADAFHFLQHLPDTCEVIAEKPLSF